MPRTKRGSGPWNCSQRSDHGAIAGGISMAVVTGASCQTRALLSHRRRCRRTWHSTTAAGPLSTSPSALGCAISRVASEVVWMTTAVTGCLPFTTLADLPAARGDR